MKNFARFTLHYRVTWPLFENVLCPVLSLVVVVLSSLFSLLSSLFSRLSLFSLLLSSPLFTLPCALTLGMFCPMRHDLD